MLAIVPFWDGCSADQYYHKNLSITGRQVSAPYKR